MHTNTHSYTRIHTYWIIIFSRLDYLLSINTHPAMPELIRLVHKNSMGLGRLMKTFREYWGAKVIASSCIGGDPMGTRERSTSPSNDSTTTTKATLTEISPFCKPKTPGATGNGSELENASGISKRQLERKIQSMAIKEARPPNHRQLWYVHDSVLQKYGIDGNALSPLPVRVASSPSVVATTTTRGGENHGNGVNSPQTPCGSGAASTSSRKRKPLAKGMKSLFDFVNSASSATTASNSNAASSGGGETGQPPLFKKPRIEDGGSNMSAVAAVTTKSSKPLATSSNTIQVLPTSTSPKGIEPPLKKARLDLTVESPKELKPLEKEVIVIDCEDSNNKDKSVEEGEKGAAPISVNLVDITNTTNATAPLPSMSAGALGNTTVATLAAAPTINLLAKLIQQCANASHR